MTLDDAGDGTRALAGLFDRAADSYDQLGVEFFTPVGADLVTRCDLRAGQRVLDLGCGRGAVLFAAADAVGPGGSVVGIDISARMARLTALDVARRGLSGVVVQQGDAGRPDFPPATFDALLAGFALFFLPDPVAAIARYPRLLVPGGALAFTSFVDQDPAYDAAMRAMAAFIPGGLAERGLRQGPFDNDDTITDMLAGAGFRAVEHSAKRYETRFADTDQWLAWTWSHAGRGVLEQVPADLLPGALDAARAEFAAGRAPGGHYVMRTDVRFTLARATGSAQ